MTRTNAKAFVKLRVPWDEDPAISDAELDALLDEAKRADSNGLGPSDTGWVETYDEWAAIAAAWELKAARVARKVSFSSDKARFDLSNRKVQFLEMAEEARKRLAVSF